MASIDTLVSGLTKIFPSVINFVSVLQNARPPSHNYDHALKTARRSLQLYHALVWTKRAPSYQDDIKNIFALAIIHDTLDTKYNDCTYETLSSILYGNLYLRAEGIAHIHKLIQCSRLVSFSYENDWVKKHQKPMDLKDLNTDAKFNYALYRDIVSDADKLLSLDEDGFERFLGFVGERTTEGTRDLLPEQVPSFVRMCSIERMLRLKDEFIRTSVGKMYAKEAHAKYLEALNGYLAKNGQELVKEDVQLIKPDAIRSVKVMAEIEELARMFDIQQPPSNPIYYCYSERTFMFDTLRDVAKQNPLWEENLENFALLFKVSLINA